MDASIVGKRIAELRKARGLTQKELAGKLHITDGAVSKWERGINFPDLSLMEPLALALGTSVIELLSLENATKNEVANAMADISVMEKEKLVKEFRLRAVCNIVIGIILFACLTTASVLFRKNHIYGLANGVTTGALSFIGTLIGSEVFLLRNIGKV